MSPIPKITNTDHKCQFIKDSIKCPYCNNGSYWKHGSYTRKGFHFKVYKNGCNLRIVQRFLCREVSCKHTFSVLPEDVLPYCRFFYNDLLDIIKNLKNGATAYFLSFQEWDLSPRILCRIKNLLKKVHPWLKELLQEALYKMAEKFETLVSTVLQKYSWFVFTRMWFHHIYPSRTGKILNPHNSGLSAP